MTDVTLPAAAAEDDNCSGPALEGCGEHLWSKRFGDADMQFGRDVAVDAAGNVIVTGEVYGTIDFGGGPLTGEGENGGPIASEGGSDGFVLMLDPMGHHILSKLFGNDVSGSVSRVIPDAAGNLILTGRFKGGDPTRVDSGWGTRPGLTLVGGPDPG